MKDVMNHYAFFILAFTILVLYPTCLIINRLFFCPLAKFPGPKLAAMTRWYEMYYDVIKGGQFMFEIERMHKIYGPIVRINPFELHIKDPDYYNSLYTGPTSKRDKYGWFVSTGVPESTFSAVKYNHHLLRRSVLGQFFSRKAVMKFEPVVQEKINLVFNHMHHSLKNNKPVELHNLFMLFAVDTVSHLAFGADRGFKALEASTLTEKWKRGITGTFEMQLTIRHFPSLYWLSRNLPAGVSSFLCPTFKSIHWMEKVTLSGYSFSKQLKYLHDEVERQTKATYFQHEKRPSNHGEKASCIISELMHSEKLPMKEREVTRVVEDAKFLLVAGTDAPSQVMAITVFHILNNPAVHERLRTELINALPDPQEKPTWSFLERLPYLNAVIKEGLRITGVVASRLPRIAPEDTLFFDSWMIPPGTPVSMSNRFILRDPKFFSDPFIFAPERWIESNQSLEKYLVPFSKGSQGCLGFNMAYLWMNLGIARLIRCFDLELFDTTEENVRIVRDCFNAQTKPNHNLIQIRVLGQVL
ncbi:benzoate 4-monooxygenase cytochrome P450 [Penicillium herquei]|nr:benzoate 4-monooxygenase cytochrome P450 [Penicillium herquei]